MAPWWLMVVAGEWWPTEVEAKALHRASLPDVRQHLNQQGGVHLGQEQQPAAAPCSTFEHHAPCGWLQRIGWSPPVTEVVCYLSFARRLYDMNENPSRNGVVRCGGIHVSEFVTFGGAFICERLGVNGKLHIVNLLLLKCGETLEK
uniref:Uncharacterized protein n=1 Tax=Oryza punctata TaxID=4537 RepID=A0A0E0LZA6_ORYPU